MTDLQRTQSDVENIYHSAVKLMSSTNLQEVCEVSVAEACRLVGAQYGSIFWEERGRLMRVYSNVPKKQHLEPRPKGNTLEVFSSLKARHLGHDQLKAAHPEIIESGINSISLIPLSHAKRPLGVITLQSKQKDDTLSPNRTKIELFSSLASLAIRNVQLHQEHEAALSQRDLFMSLASHELKTPLTVINSSVQILGKKFQDQENEEAALVARISRSLQKLKMIVDEFFSVSELNAGKINLNKQKIAIGKLVEKTIEDLRTVHERELIFKNKLGGEHDLIDLDEQKFSLALTNIINNAVKYSPKQSAITIFLQKKWNGVRISVTDRGSGIDPEDLPKIYSPFFQGAHKKGGLGLGLYLTREIIEAHGGEVAVVSKMGKGTRISLWVPYG